MQFSELFLPEDIAELHRRLAEHEAEPASAIPLEEVRQDLFAASDDR